MIPECEELARELHANGVSAAKIAAKVGYHPVTVQRYLTSLGHKLSQGRLMITGEVLQMIRDKRAEGMPWADLEALMGFSANQMRIRLKS